MFAFLLIVQTVIAVALIGTILMQRSEGGGLGIGGGGGFMTNRGTANVLTRATAILAGLFFLTSLILSILAGFDRQPSSIIGGGSQAPATAPGAPGSAPPLRGGQGGLLNQLGGGSQQAPATPSGPTVPQSK